MRKSTWKKLLDGQSGIRKLEDPFVEQYDLPVRIGGHLLEDFDGELTRVELRRLSYLQKMSTVLGRRVWENAGSPEVDTKRLMVSIGTGMGSTEELRLRLRRHARARVCGRCHRWPCRCTCPTRAAAAVGLERQAKAGVMHPDLGVRVRLRGHRARLAQHRARRGRHRDLRRRRDQDRGGAHRRVRPDANRAVHHQRRPGRCVPPVRQGPQRVRVRRGRRAAWSSRPRSTPRRAVPTSWPG